MLDIVSVLVQFFKLQVSTKASLLKIFVIHKLGFMKRQLVTKNDCLLIDSC